MNADTIKNRISELVTHFTFEYKGKSCGVDPYNAHKFNMWNGNGTITVHSIDEVMNTEIFDGKSLTEICNDIEVIDF